MHRSIWVSLLVLTGLLAGAVTPGEAALAKQGFPPQGAAPIVSPLADGLLLEWSAPEPRIRQLEIGEAEITLSGYENSAGPGAWKLPQASALVALPPDGEPVLETVAEQTAAVRLAAQPGRVSARTAEMDGEVLPLSLPDVLEPQPVVTFTELGIMRGVRLGRVTFTPLHETERGWQFTRSIKVRLRTISPTAPQPATVNDAWVEQIRGQVVNPTQVQASFPVTPAEPSSYSLAGEPTALVSVRSAGITVISYNSLKNTGFPVDSANPHQLHLTRSGVESAMEWEGDADAVFEQGERLLFFAAPRFSRWTADDVYALRQETTLGKRISARNGSPAGLAAGSATRSLLVEQNRIYMPDGLAGRIPAGYNGDRWVWDDIRWPIEKSAQYSFDLPSVDAGQAARLDVWLIGFTLSAVSPDHKAVIAINGVTLGTVEWDGKTAKTASLSVPANTLRTGLNQLTVTMPGPQNVSIDGIYVDAFRLEYVHGAGSWGSAATLRGDAAPRAYAAAVTDTVGLRLYDTTMPEEPSALNGFTLAGGLVSFGDPGSGGRSYALAAESGLQAPTSIRMAQPVQAQSGADYLVISHAAFLPALDPLLNLRSSQGLQVAVEDVQSIYDTYGGGHPEPEAIRAYLADVYARWNPRPMYVLLVGDGTTDPRRYYSTSPITYLPPMLADVDPWAGETAADNRYVTVHGDDPLPDMAIGRLPANTLAQAQVMVTKVVQYEAQPAGGLWHSDLTLVADKVDGDLNFAGLAERLSGRLPGSAIARRLYFEPKGASEAEREAERVQMRQAVLANWNAGTSVMLYAGHGSVHQWGEDILIHLNQIPALTNASRLPLLVELTCLTGAFQSPAFETLDEALLRLPGGGVAAAWGATGLGVATGHEALATVLVDHLFDKQPESLGLSILAAKLNLALTRPYDVDLLDTYTLLGDPATIISTQANQRNNLFVPLIRR